MEENKIFFNGKLLISMPGLDDGLFSHSVVCISEHKKEGALGFIINKPHQEMLCRDVFSSLGIEFSERAGLSPVYVGGPVQPDSVFVLHAGPFEWEGCFRFPPGLAISNTIDIVRAIARDEGPRKYLMMLGCSGWGEDQLESEILSNFWLTSDIDHDLVFDFEPECRWREAMHRIGVDPGLICADSGTA